MISISCAFALLGLLQAAQSRSLPTRTQNGQAAAAQEAVIPTPTLTSDFKKNNVSASWADGFPKEWGTEEAKFEYPVEPGQYIWSRVTNDEKYLAIANDSAVKILELDSGTVLAERNLNTGGVRSVLFQPGPEGGYDLLIPTDDFYNDPVTLQFKVSSEGEITGEPIRHHGATTSVDPFPFSADGRRMLTMTRLNVYAFGLDDSSYNLTLEGHNDRVMSSQFSPDGKYIATTSWDQSTRLLDATTGELIYNFGPSGGQNWITRFSPDSEQLLISTGSSLNVVRIYQLDDLDAEPLVLDNYNDWIRSAQWSPDGGRLATGDYGQILVYKMPEAEIIQAWQMEDRDNEVSDLRWLEGGDRLIYRVMGGLEMYDFDSNLKYRWGPDGLAQFTGSGGPTDVLEERGWIGGSFGDAVVRFWEYPE